MKNIIIYSFIISLVWINGLSLKGQSLSYEQYKLKNGLQVTLIDYGTVDATTIRLYVNVGKKCETPAYQGIANFTAQALTFGNAKYDKIQLADLFNPMSSGISASANDNYTVISSTFLNRDLDKAMEIFAATMRQPTFPEVEVKQQIAEFMQYNNPRKMDITELASRFSDYFVYGLNNPLGRNTYAAQVGKLTFKNIKEFYDFNYTPKNTRIVIAGKIDHAKIKQLIETYFNNWETVYGENNQVSLEAPSFKGKEYGFVNRDEATQCCLYWAKKAPMIGDKDVLPFKVASVVFNRKLFEEVREKLGKTYGIYMGYNERANNGIYTVSTSTRSEQMSTTLEAFDKTIADFYSKGITENELKLTKTKMKNEYLAVNNPGSIIEFYNPLVFPDIKKRMNSFAEIDALTLETVNKVIKKYYTPESYKLIIAGSEKDLSTQLAAIKGLQKFANNIIEADQ